MATESQECGGTAVSDFNQHTRHIIGTSYIEFNKFTLNILGLILRVDGNLYRNISGFIMKYLEINRMTSEISPKQVDKRLDKMFSM